VFQGETAITVDDKGRMAVPTAYRDLVARASGNRLVLTYNPFEPAACGCTQVEWERVRDDVMAKPNLNRGPRVAAEAGRLGRPSGAGRQRSHQHPASHRAAVGIEKKAVLLGMGDKFELWSEQAHRDLIQQTLSDEDLGDGLLDLKL
jgi:MraZ protein